MAPPACGVLSVRCCIAAAKRIWKILLSLNKTEILLSIGSRMQIAARTAFIAAAAARGGASFRSADAAQVLSNVGFVVVHSAYAGSVATSAKQTVSERW